MQRHEARKMGGRPQGRCPARTLFPYRVYIARLIGKPVHATWKADVRPAICIGMGDHLPVFPAA